MFLESVWSLSKFLWQKVLLSLLILLSKWKYSENTFTSYKFTYINLKKPFENYTRWCDTKISYVSFIYELFILIISILFISQHYCNYLLKTFIFLQVMLWKGNLYSKIDNQLGSLKEMKVDLCPLVSTQITWITFFTYICLKDARSVSWYPYNRSQVLQYVLEY